MTARIRPSGIALFATLIAAAALTPVGASARPDASATQIRYTVTALETLGGSSSFAFGINERGQVAGFAALPGDLNFHAALWTGGAVRDLGTLPGHEDSFAYDVNDAGVVAGRSGLFPDDERAVRWEEGVMTDLGTLGGPRSEAQAINSAGTIVGSANAVGPMPLAAAWTSTGVVDLGLNAPSIAYDVNDRGHIVGYGYAGGRAWIFKRGELRDLGTLGGTASEARALNSEDEVVGLSHVEGDTETHAVLWREGKIKDLGTLGGGAVSGAEDINNRGQIVGFSLLCCEQEGISHAFVVDGKMRDLNDLIPAGTGWELYTANAINERGEIVGIGFLNGVERAFLLTPR